MSGQTMWLGKAGCSNNNRRQYQRQDSDVFTYLLSMRSSLPHHDRPRDSPARLGRLVCAQKGSPATHACPVIFASEDSARTLPWKSNLGPVAPNQGISLGSTWQRLSCAWWCMMSISVTLPGKQSYQRRDCNSFQARLFQALPDCLDDWPAMARYDLLI